MPKIEVTNDFFIRTSDPRHGAKVAEIMQRVYDNGWVSKGIYEGWYCPRCADFKTERELGPGNTCPIHEIPLEREREENWFFRLSAFQERLERLYEEHPDFVVPDFRRNEAVSFIKQGLEDVSLSRPKLKWGMKLPWDDSQRMYVWFDALLNYYTALTFAREGEDLSESLLAGRPARDGQGHPQVPRGDLAGALHGRGDRAAAAHGHPRLPADGREEDVEVARQRPRPVRGDRPVRRRRVALLPLPRGQLRPGRLDLDCRASRLATRPSWPTSSATSPAAPWRCSTATATASIPGRPRSIPSSPPASRARRRQVARPARRGPGQRRPGGDLERWSGGSTATSRRQSPGSWPRRRRTRRRWTAALYNLAEGLRVVTLLLLPYLPSSADRLLAALGEEGRGAGRVRLPRGRGPDRAAAAALSEDRGASLSCRVGASETPIRRVG